MVERTPVSSITLNCETAALRVSGTIQLSATAMPETATNKGVTWSSSDDAVAKVSADGLVTAMSIGEALITATAVDGSGVTATCRVTVGATPAEGVSIAADGETTLKVGGAVQLRATVTPETATDKSVDGRRQRSCHRGRCRHGDNHLHELCGPDSDNRHNCRTDIGDVNLVRQEHSNDECWRELCAGGYYLA